MSDPALATRAPETDAAEDTLHQPPPSTHQPSEISANDSIAQTGPSMGEHCTTDRPLLNTETQPTGTTTTMNDISTYISKPADYPSTPAKLLLLLTGGTGIESINNKLQADIFASHGFLVIMPDQFGGDPASASTNRITSPTSPAQSSPSIIEQVKQRVAETAKSFSIDMWLARQTPEKVLPRLHAVLEGVRDEYADAVSHGGGIYAVGYCFGARYVLILGGDQAAQSESADEESSPAVSKGPAIKCGAIAHATLVTREDLKGVKVPVSMVVVENDPLFPDEVLNVGRKHLGASTVEHEIRTYEGVPHGFAVVGEYEDSSIKGKQEEAFEQMVGWLKRH